MKVPSPESRVKISWALLRLLTTQSTCSCAGAVRTVYPVQPARLAKHTRRKDSGDTAPADEAPLLGRRAGTPQRAAPVQAGWRYRGQRKHQC